MCARTHGSTGEQPAITIFGVMASRLPISTAPYDGTLIRFWSPSEVEPVIGYWLRTFIGWVAYHEDVPLIRHDVTGWERSPTRRRRGPSHWRRSGQWLDGGRRGYVLDASPDERAQHLRELGRAVVGRFGNRQEAT
jgi:hypothetical protein